MTPEQATDLAERINAAISSAVCGHGCCDCLHTDADRERVASDLRAWHRAAEGLAEHLSGALHCGCDPTLLEPCSDLRRYAEAQADAEAGLTRTGALYGVTP